MEELLEKLRASLSDRYDVERKLGEGGMATVFLARDIRHERRVAIKVLHEDLGAALGAERFRREIQIATSLTHPHILTLYDSGEAAGSLFYVMPFIEGESLRHRIDREKMLPIDQALKITQEVAGALDYAHRKGVIHRDIKPENILLEDGHAIVADFGIARAVSSMGDAGGALTKTGMSLGTPTYMSPEQAFAEKDIDGRSDLYSLACVLYEMLTGQPPFTGSNAQAVMAKHSMAEVPSMQIVRATVPDEVEDVVQKALSKSPADRFATVGEFSEELQECVIDYHTTTRRTMGTGRTTAGRRAIPKVRPPLWKRPAILGGAVGVILLAAAGAWFGLGRTRAATAEGAFKPQTVAVLYFDDVSSGEKLRYLADGLTETLIDRLSDVQALDVISKGGVAQYRGTSVGVDSIAKALSAGTIIRGTVGEDGDKFKIGVRVVDGNSGDLKTQKDFEIAKANVVDAQDSLATQVSDYLRTVVGDEARLRQERAGTSNAVAWTLVQRAEKLRKDGIAQANGGDSTASSASFERADSLLVQAEGLDKNWIDPIAKQSALAQSRVLLMRDPLEAKPWIDRGVADANRALQRDKKNAMALEARGTLLYRKWYLSLASNDRAAGALLDSAQSDLGKAVEIDPERAQAWATLSDVYAQNDDLINGNLAAQNAYRADAYLAGTDQVLWNLFSTFYDLNQLAGATKYCSEGAQRFPANPSFARCKLLLFTMPKVVADTAEALVQFNRLKDLTPKKRWELQQHEASMFVAAAYAKAGKLEAARKMLRDSRADAQTDPQGTLQGEEAFVWTLLGTAADTTEAIEVLKRYLTANPQHRKGYRETVSWWWTGLKTDRRFISLVGSAGN